MEVAEKSKKTEVKGQGAGMNDIHVDHSRDISIWLDNYDDLFSDFDPRPFSERNVSDDFLNELKKVSGESDYFVNELHLLVPEKNRDQEQEAIISRRIHSFFRRNVHLHEEQVKSQKMNGFLFVFIAVVMMMSASYISSLKSENLLMHILLIILEPAGWFLMWTGLDSLINSPRKKMPELNFYSKMSKCKIIFRSILKTNINEKNN
jgi:hypothetical protein